jgi:hypothetical protein
MRTKPIIGVLMALLVAPAAALAQTGEPDPGAPGDNSDSDTSNAPNRDSDPADEELSSNDDTSNDPGGPLPASKSDDDVQPPVATPGTPEGMVVRQAGVGGQVGYGRAGVLELGGSAGFMAAPSFTSVNFTPEIGWFVADNLELSGRLGFTYARADDGNGSSSSGSITTAIVEPSYHLPFTKTAFGFLGMGMGAAYVSGPGMGFAVAPRIGGNFLIGRSGVLTPALSWQYTTHDTQMVGENARLLVVSSALMANVGYTVMW